MASMTGRLNAEPVRHAYKGDGVSDSIDSLAALEACIGERRAGQIGARDGVGSRRSGKGFAARLSRQSVLIVEWKVYFPPNPPNKGINASSPRPVPLCISD